LQILFVLSKNKVGTCRTHLSEKMERLPLLPSG